MDTNKDSHTWFEKVEFLTEALPYMHQYNGSSIVIKFGGHAMTDNKVLSSFLASTAAFVAGTAFAFAWAQTAS